MQWARLEFELASSIPWRYPLHHRASNHPKILNTKKKSMNTARYLFQTKTFTQGDMIFSLTFTLEWQRTIAAAAAAAEGQEKGKEIREEENERKKRRQKRNKRKKRKRKLVLSERMGLRKKKKWTSWKK